MKEKLKQSRAKIRWEQEYSSLYIKETYSNLRSISISIKIVFESAVLALPVEKEYSRTLTPNDRLFLHYDCLNPGCTGHGFDLTNILRASIERKQCIQGTLFCDGKEDWKYLRASGCSCMTKLFYKIDPEFI